MKYLLSLLLLCLLFVILPAAAMPVLVDHGNLADWKTEQNDGPEPQIIDLGNGNMRVWLDTSKNVRFTKSIDFTGVNQITFKLQNYEMDDFKPSGIRFAVSIDDESKLALKWNDIENGIKNGKTWEVNTKGYSGDHKLGFSFICSNKADGMGLEVHDLSIIANTAVPSPSALTLDHDAIKLGESVTAEISFIKGDRPDRGDELRIDWGDRTITTHPTANLASPCQISHQYGQEGTYQITCWGHNRDGGFDSPKQNATVTVIAAKITAIHA